MQASSLESFLDEFQRVRLVVTTTSLVALVGLIFVVGTEPLVPYIGGLAITAAHAVWSVLRRVRAPLSMLAIDTTVWGSIMVVADIESVSTALFALLVTNIVIFSDGYLRIGFAGYSLAWYAASVFDGPVSADAIGVFVGVVLIVAGLALVMHRIRGWLGRLDANRSQLLGTVSHELRNNLTGILGLTQIVSTDPSLGTTEARELVAMAHQQAVDAGEIVEDLLTAARVERSTLTVARSTVDLEDEIATTVRRFRQEGTELTVDIDPHLPTVTADGLRVRQILRNLVSNAIRYGGPTIALRAGTAGATVSVVVADDGSGVPLEDMKTLFLPYRRSSQPLHGSSVGLGLWISRELARAMGGDLVYRRIDTRSEFILTLPTGPPERVLATGRGGQTHRSD